VRFTGNVPASLAAITRRLIDAETAPSGWPSPASAPQVVYGESDDGWPIPVQKAMAEILGVEPQVVPDAGHSPAIDQQAATARLLVDFFHDR
jgi:pimeloyl-ACP methyl ester carboxylesterase